MFTRAFWNLFYQRIPALRRLGQEGIKFFDYTSPHLRKKIIIITCYQNRRKRVENEEKKPDSIEQLVLAQQHNIVCPASPCQPLHQITQLCSLDILIVVLSPPPAPEEVNLSAQGKTQEYNGAHVSGWSNLSTPSYFITSEGKLMAIRPWWHFKVLTTSEQTKGEEGRRRRKKRKMRRRKRRGREERKNKRMEKMRSTVPARKSDYVANKIVQTCWGVGAEVLH